MAKQIKHRSSPSTTPMMRQYTRIKAQFPDTILFFRLGDFYEMFGQDAVIASKVLGIALTSRNKGKNAIPLAGIPHHASETYLAKLIRAGLKVAVCEQIEDPATAKGVVKREVVRVITPGTVYEENIIPHGDNLYLAAFCRGVDSFGIAYADVSTGEFAVDVIESGRLLAEANRISPKELLVSSADKGLAELLSKEYCSQSDVALELLDEVEFEPEAGLERLKRVFGELPDGFPESEWFRAACALASYLDRTQCGNLGQFRSIRINALSDSLALDARTLRNLEVVSSISGGRKSSLLGVCDFTVSAMGARLLRKWLAQPLTDLGRIERRQAAVDVLMERRGLRNDVQERIRRMCDLQRVTARVAALRASPRDLGAIRDTLKQIADLQQLLGDAPPPLDMMAVKLEPLPELHDYLARIIVELPPVAVGEGNVIREGVDEKLDELRSIRKGGKNWIAEYQRRESRRTGISSLKIGFNSVFGYYIEISKANLRNVPDDYIRKQTLINAERFITPELKEYESKVLSAEEGIHKIESEIFRNTRERASLSTQELYSLSENLAALDVLCGFARLAEERSYTIPKVHKGIEIRIKDGRHPVVEASLPQGSFVPNDTIVTPKNLIHIITGPNMAGKSTYIRQVAQIVILAQAGAPVPAKSAKIGLVDRLFTRIGAGDDLARGRSTFMVEMLETSDILQSATQRSLIILDEVGRGTSTFDGLSLAWAVCEYIHNSKACSARTLFATHYHELTELAAVNDRIKNYNVLVREWQGDVVFLHRIEPGASDRSYGIYVAKLAGMPGNVVKRANEILRILEKQAFDIEGKPRRSGLRGPSAKRDVQLLLFESPYEYLLDEVRDADLDKMTPIEALHFLARMKKELDT